MRDFTSSRSEKKKQPQSTIRERNRIDLILDPDPASETLNPHTKEARFFSAHAHTRREETTTKGILLLLLYDVKNVLVQQHSRALRRGFRPLGVDDLSLGDWR